MTLDHVPEFKSEDIVAAVDDHLEELREAGDALPAEVEKQRIYRATFERLTGKKSVGEVKMAYVVESRKYLQTGLEGQVEMPGADGMVFLRTIFTPVKRYRRDNNKFLAAEEDKKRTSAPVPHRKSLVVTQEEVK